MKRLPKISDSEWQVMRVVWKKSPISTNEVVEKLTPATLWKPKTIMTLLNRLVKKGVLGFVKKGRGYQYHPLLREDECIAVENRSFLQKVYGGSLKPMLINFLSEARLSKKEIEDLKRILDEGSEER